MSTWILILTFLNNGTAVYSAEFETKEKCEIAAKKYIDVNDRGFSVARAFCVEK